MREHDEVEYAPPADAGLFAVDFDPERAEVIVIGVPWEPTVSYGRGTGGAPKEMVPASHQLDFFDAFLGADLDIQVGMPPLREDWFALNDQAIALADPIISQGGRLGPGMAEQLAQVNALSQTLNQSTYEEVRGWLERGKSVGLLGGDHSCPLGAIRAHAARFPGMGILHIDAHHDLRKAYEGFTYSHASIMYNVLQEVEDVAGIVSVGIRDYSADEASLAKKSSRVTTFYDRDVQQRLFRGDRWAEIAAEICEALPQDVYVSFDIDGLDPKLCPHTGTPVPGGLQYGEAIFLLEALLQSGRRVVGFDLCEVGTHADEEWDLNVGARILHKLCVLTYQSRSR